MIAKYIANIKTITAKHERTSSTSSRRFCFSSFVISFVFRLFYLPRGHVGFLVAKLGKQKRHRKNSNALCVFAACFWRFLCVFCHILRVFALKTLFFCVFLRVFCVFFDFFTENDTFSACFLRVFRFLYILLTDSACLTFN